MSKVEVSIVFIRNSKGEFFLHQRLASKKKFPNKFGIGAGGHIDEGETPENAAVRELFEETGLRTPVKYLFTMDFDLPDFQQISHAYVTETDETLRTDETEWQWSGWMKKEAVDRLLADGKLCTDTGVMYERYIQSIDSRSM